MRYVNDLYGKQIINEATGERVATVRDVVLSEDMKEIVALLIGGGLFHDDRVVRWSTIRSVGDVIVADTGDALPPVRDDEAVATLRERAFRITGLRVITAAGESVGTVADTAFDDSGRVLGFVLKHGVLGGKSGATFVPVESVQAIGPDAIIATHAALPSVREFERPAAESSAGDEVQRESQ